MPMSAYGTFATSFAGKAMTAFRSDTEVGRPTPSGSDGNSPDYQAISLPSRSAVSAGRGRKGCSRIQASDRKRGAR